MSDYTPALLRAVRQQAARMMDTEHYGDPDRVDYHSPAWSAMARRVVMMRDVYGGTETVRAAGSTYLPMQPMEERADYQARLDRAVLFNGLGRTVQAQVGMVFRKDPVLQDDVPARIVADADNIDLRGRAFPVFARDVFESALVDGHTLVHVDAPAADGVRAVGGSRADVMRSGRRPYWRHVSALDLINWDYGIQDGKPVLTLAVLAEWQTERAGRYGSRLVRHYRELLPGGWILHREDPETQDISVVAEGMTTLDEIPLVPVYGRRTGFLESVPVHLDLAFENLEHYRVRSDHTRSLEFAGISIPVFIGAERENIEWGAARSVFMAAPEAKAMMLETSGQSLGASRQELADIEERMAALGLATLVKQGRTQRTATESHTDKQESDSQLAAMARGLRDSLEEALRIHAAYYREASGGSVEVSRDFDSLTISPQMVRELSNMVAQNHLTLDTMWAILIEGELLPETFDAEEERTALEASLTQELSAIAAMGRPEPGEEP